MPEISDDELKKLKDDAAKATTLESSNKRLLEESDKNKKRAQEAEGKLTDAEKKKLAEEGKTNELLLQSEKEKADLAEKLKLRTKQTVKEKVRTEVAKVAKDAHDIDMVLRVSEHKDLLKIDEDNLTVEGVDDYVKKVRESHSYLFGKKKMPIDGDGKPPGSEGDPQDERTDDQKFIDELKTVTNRADQLKVYKKYGKPVDSFMQRQ